MKGLSIRADQNPFFEIGVYGVGACVSTFLWSQTAAMRAGNDDITSFFTLQNSSFVGDICIFEVAYQVQISADILAKESSLLPHKLLLCVATLGRSDRRFDESMDNSLSSYEAPDPEGSP